MHRQSDQHRLLPSMLMCNKAILDGRLSQRLHLRLGLGLGLGLVLALALLGEAGALVIW